MSANCLTGLDQRLVNSCYVRVCAHLTEVDNVCWWEEPVDDAVDCGEKWVLLFPVTLLEDFLRTMYMWQG